MQILRREDIGYLEMNMVKASRYASVILLGIWTVVSQIILIREFLVVFYGNELIFGVAMASWFIGVSIGAISAAILSKRFKNDLPLFVYSQIIALAVLPVAIYLIRNARNIIGVPTGLMIPFITTAIFSFFIIITVTFIAGFCFPLAARIFKNIGAAYILEGLGSFLGGVVFSFLLAGRIDHFTVIFAISSLVTFNLALLSGRSNRIIYVISLCLFAMFILGAGWRLDTFTSKMRLKSINPQMEMLKSADSRYQNITIARLQDQFSVLCDGRFMFNFPDDYNQEVFINIAMNQHLGPRRVLLIGSGIAGEIYQILKYPIERLDYVELDPELIRLTAPFILKKDRDALNDKRLYVYFCDGRFFVNKTGSEYDLIIVNIADPSTAMLNRFYTREFFSQIKRILKKDGVFTIGIASGLNFIGPDIEKYAGSIYKTLNNVFPYVAVAPGDRNQFFCSVSNQVVTTYAVVLERRFLEKKIQSVYFRPELFRDIFFPERVKFLRDTLKRAQAPINTDLQPISYYYNLILWNLFSDSRPQSNIFRDLAKIDLFKIILFAQGAFLLTRLVWIISSAALKKRPLTKHTAGVEKFNSCWAIFTVGFAAMAFEIILIFSFQNIYGYVYEMLGLIIGVFMFGMIAAATFSNNVLLRFPEHLNLTLLINQALIVIFAFILPFGSILHIPFIFLAGFLTGMAFPLACRMYSDTKETIGFTAGVIDSADLIGGCAGVILTGTLLIPLLGITKTCFVIGALNLTSVALIFLASFHEKSLLP